MVSMANALMRFKRATLDDFIKLAQGLLIDAAISSIERQAPKDPTGKRVGSGHHTIFVRSVEAMAELERIRRSYYGRLWIEAATEALESTCSSCKIGYSPSRNRSYVMYAFSLEDKDREGKLTMKALQAMKQHGTGSCVALGGTMLNILATFNTILDWARGKTSAELPDEYVLDTTAIFLESNF